MLPQLELTEFDAASGPLFTRRKQLPVRIEFFINKRACRTEIHNFGAVFRCAKAGT